MFKDFIYIAYDKKNKSIRGSFVNLIVTFTILSLVCAGAFNKEVTANLKELTTLILGFFGISFSVWTYGKVQQINKTDSNPTSTDGEPGQ